MTAASQLIEDMLRMLERFYPDNKKAFKQQRKFLVDGIMLLPRYLKKRAVTLPDDRLRKIITALIFDIQRKGGISEYRFFCRYWLKVVQTHLAHHGDEYYEEGKSLRNALDKFTSTLIGDLSEKDAKRLTAAQDDITEQLVALDRIFKSGPRPGKKKADSQKKAAAQMTFFS